MKKMITRDTILSYPDFNAPFDIHTYASKYQLGALIGQGKPISFTQKIELGPEKLHYYKKGAS